MLRVGEGNDTVTFRYVANNTIEGGAGNDRIQRGASADTYLFNRGDGQDVINDDSSGYTTTGTLVLGAGIRQPDSINTDQLWFRHVGNNLNVSIIGTSDMVTVENWYFGSAYHVEQFQSADGKMLLDTQVENLVQAMASFVPPAVVQTPLSQDYQDALVPGIAANWQ